MSGRVQDSSVEGYVYKYEYNMEFYPETDILTTWKFYNQPRVHKFWLFYFLQVYSFKRLSQESFLIARRSIDI